MYASHRNPTELYYESHNERDALLRQEARNKRLTLRPLMKLVAIVMFVGLASIVLGPGRAIDYLGTYLLSETWIIGVLAVVVGLLMLKVGKASDDRTNLYDGLSRHVW